MRVQQPLDQLNEAKLREQIRQNKRDLIDPDGADERAKRRRRADEIRQEQAERRKQAIITVLFRNPKRR